MRIAFAQPSMPRPSDVLPGRAEPITAPGTHFVNGHPLAGPYPEALEVA